MTDNDRTSAPARRRLVELSHVIRDGLVTYPGLPGPTISPHLTRAESRANYAAGTEFAMDRISMIGNTGTYLDSPFHRYADGADLAGLPLERLADLPALVVRVPHEAAKAVSREMLSAVLDPAEVAGAAVLAHTGWDRHFGTAAYGDPAPHLTEDAARWLVAAGAVLVGIDSVNIDDMLSQGPRPAHSVLLAADVPILEHLTNLAALPDRGARLHAAPPRVAGFGTFPVRAYALID